jgi:hypothetical protein
VYLNTETLEYPVTEREIRSRYALTSFPVPFVAPEPYVWVFPTPKPEFNPLVHLAKVGTPALQANGNWEQQWVLESLAPEVAAQAQQRSAEKLQKDITDAIQERLDAFARTRGYDHILSAATYATSAVPQFRAEGQYCINARDATWAKAGQMLAEIQGGTRPIPGSYADFEPELPVLAWPT